MYSLEEVLYSKSIAVVGASSNPGKMGHTILKNIIDGGYEGEIYPINLKEDSILGVKCYPSVGDIPKNIDLVVIVVPAHLVKDIIVQAGEKGAKGAIIISGGFREIGNDDLEKEMLKAAKEYGIHVIGPNCQGVNYTANKMCATWPLVKTQGPIGIVAQSGTIGAAIELWAEKEGLGISCFAALGNKSDVSEVDFIEFFATDPNTKVIALNIEGIQDGKEFIDTIERASKKKPVIIIKPGRTAKGREAAASHTKSIGGNDQIFSALCKKYGLVRAEDITEFYDFCKIAATTKKVKGNKMLIVTSSGGAGILATDTAERVGVNIAPLSDKLKSVLKDVLPNQCVISNPLDLTGDATAERYEETLNAVIENDNYDMILTIFGDPIPGAFDVINKIRAKSETQIIVSYLGGGEIEEKEVELMNKNGIPAFPTPERAVNAAKTLLDLRK